MHNVIATEPAAVLSDLLRPLLTEEQWEKIADETGVSEVAVVIVAELQKQTSRECPAAQALLSGWTGTSVQQSAVRETLRALHAARNARTSELAVQQS